MRRLSVMILLLVPFRDLAADASPYECIGVGGAGGIFGPAGSVVDPNFMLVSCDMSGCYRSYDRGRTWQLINWNQIVAFAGDSQCRPYFHPKNDKIAVWRGWITVDKARTWRRLAPFKKEPWGRNGRTRHVACSADESPAVYIGATTGFWGSHDGLKTWKKYGTGGCTGVQVLEDNTAYAAIGGALYKWKAGRGEPARTETPGVSGQIRALAVGGTGEAHTIHVVASGGVYTSGDSGGTWRRSHSQGNVADVVMARNQTKAAYACDRMNVYATADGGSTWKSTFKLGGNIPRSWVQKDIRWGYYIVMTGLGCGQGSPGTVMVSTQAELFISHDYGKTWEFRHTKELGAMPGGGTRNQSTGLEVTGSWDYYFDPSEPNRHYAGFSDFGFMRSVDGGRSWAWAARGCPWSNTFYDVAFDPFQKGKMYAATTRRHEIIHWICCTPTTAPGGVCVSEDFAASWKPLRGLPEAPCTAIEVDRKNSKPGAVVLYTALWGRGVYKSTDSGQTWQHKPGVGRAGNRHVFMIKIHPKTNDVYCNVSANRSGSTFAVAGGLWKSSDGGDTWTELTAGMNIKWLNGYCVHPENPDIVYITGAAIPGANGSQGGVYRTTDGGKKWKRILKDSDFHEGYVHGLFVDFHPDDPRVLYFSGTEGLWASPDGGENWRFLKEVPFKVCHRVRFDPRNRNVMYICTDGAGVLRGPALKGVPGERASLAVAKPASSSRQSRPKRQPPKRPAAPAGPTKEQVAAASAAREKLTKAVIDGLAGGKKASIYIDLMGRATRGRLLGADEAAIKVSAAGMETSIKWSSLTPRRFYGIARKYSSDHELLEAYCRGKGLTEEAERERIGR